MAVLKTKYLADRFSNEPVRSTLVSSAFYMGSLAGGENDVLILCPLGAEDIFVSIRVVDGSGYPSPVTIGLCNDDGSDFGGWDASKMCYADASQSVGFGSDVVYPTIHRKVKDLCAGILGTTGDDEVKKAAYLTAFRDKVPYLCIKYIEDTLVADAAEKASLIVQIIKGSGS